MIVKRATIDDIDFIRSVYADEEIYHYISDDGSNDPNEIDYGALISIPHIYVMIPSVNTPVGVLLFYPWNTITFELHTAIVKEHRGKEAIEAAKVCGFWMFENTNCQKIVTSIPAGNFPAKYLARKCGMKYIGNNEKSYLKGGTLHDQHLYGICKEEAYKCQQWE